MTTWRSRASTATMIQRPSSPPCQNTFGSRKSEDPVSSTGLPAYRVHVTPPSRLYARDWAWTPGRRDALVYALV